jgi:hypothetical protein
VTAFADTDDVYARLGRVLQQLARDPELAPSLEAADTCVRYELHEPDATITVGSRGGAPVRVDLGPSEQEPEVVMRMDADIAHSYFMGDVDMTVALARGQITAEGPVSKILAVLPAVEPLLPRYRALVSPAGGGGGAKGDEAPRPGI